MKTTTIKQGFGVMFMSCSILFSSQTLAATIVIDDASFGSQSVLRDTTNNLDYLRLDFTMGYGYNGVTAQLGAGGDFDGWQVASSSDMLSLGSSVGISNGSTDTLQVSLAESLRDWFCPTGTCVNLSSTHEYARGLISDAGPVYASGAPSQDAFSIGRRFNVEPNEVDYRISGYGGLDHLNEEVFLVRASVVPVPAAVWLFVSGIGGLGLISRRRA
ncbi:MAG: VPLPA-CTERM sorting domain-containing protein [Gammaproteobacteria bacterium]|nr:VPLPA-CTERM sorting domain-containing protein [Gammaproteobacteria bacterium]